MPCSFCLALSLANATDEMDMSLLAQAEAAVRDMSHPHWDAEQNHASALRRKMFN